MPFLYYFSSYFVWFRSPNYEHLPRSQFSLNNIAERSEKDFEHCSECSSTNIAYFFFLIVILLPIETEENRFFVAGQEIRVVDFFIPGELTFPSFLVRYKFGYFISQQPEDTIQLVFSGTEGDVLSRTEEITIL